MYIALNKNKINVINGLSNKALQQRTLQTDALTFKIYREVVRIIHSQ